VQPAARRPAPATVPLAEEAAVARVQPTEEEVALPSTPTVPVPPSFADADAAYQERRFADAVDLFEAYVEQKPNNPWGLYMLGLSAWKAGQLQKAGFAFEEALKLDPKHEKSLLNWSRVLLEQGEPGEALARIETALDLNPVSNDATRLLARARDALGETEGAIAAYKEALALDDQDAWSMNNLGYLYIRQGREAEALPALARATELRADVAVFQNNLGVALERTGHIAVATQAYRNALAADSTCEKASISLARAEALHEGSSVEATFLSDLAQGFAAEVQGWRQSALSRTELPAAGEETAEILDAAVSRSYEPRP